MFEKTYNLCYNVCIEGKLHKIKKEDLTLLS